MLSEKLENIFKVKYMSQGFVWLSETVFRENLIKNKDLNSVTYLSNYIEKEEQIRTR